MLNPKRPGAHFAWPCHLAQPMLQPQTFNREHITQGVEGSEGKYGSGMNVHYPGCSGHGARDGIWCPVVVAPQCRPSTWLLSLLGVQISIYTIPDSSLNMIDTDKAKGRRDVSENVALTIRNLNSSFFSALSP